MSTNFDRYHYAGKLLSIFRKMMPTQFKEIEHLLDDEDFLSSLCDELMFDLKEHAGSLVEGFKGNPVSFERSTDPNIQLICDFHLSVIK